MNALVVATSNEHKLQEIVFELKDTGILTYSLKDFPPLAECPETGRTFLENARLKADYYFRHLQRPVLTEDSGLVIAALSGFPGILSARIAPDDTSKIQLILKRLGDSLSRSASYICSMVFRTAERIYEAEGECHGIVNWFPAGDQGFGYDPIFRPEDSNQTFAQMPLQMKSRFSHRGRAVRKILPFLVQELAAGGRNEILK